MESQKILERAFADGRLSHAYLFRGQEGCGQLLTAKWLMQLVNCRGGKKPCGTCSSCQKIEKDLFQDGRFLYPTGDTVPVHKVEVVRELIHWINLMPSEGNYRVAVIVQAEAMNLQAANSLLKTLEEAPSRGLIILVSSQSSRLLPTLLSRCIPMDFKPLSQEALAGALTQSHSIPFQQATELAHRSAGRLEKALSLIQSPEEKSDTEVLYGQVRDALEKGNAAALIYLALQVSNRMKEETRGEPPFLEEFQKRFYVEHQGKLPSDEMEKRLYRIEKAKEELRGRSNPRLVLENLFLYFNQ